jgi:TPR repeat protein
MYKVCRDGFVSINVNQGLLSCPFQSDEALRCRPQFTKIFVLILCAILSLVTITRAIGSTGDDNGGNSTRAHELVARAKQLLEGGVRNGKDSKRAFDLLIAASGIDRIYIDKRNNSDNNDISLIFADDVVIQWRTAVERHIEAVRTLVDLFWSGDGAPLNPAIAHRLVIELADGGDSGAQVELGVLLASGIRPVAVMGPKKAVKASGVNYFVLGQPDVPKALVHYYFAARGGDALAQMALGYRHLYGLGVPQSCPTAAKYYNAVAERVIDMAKRPESLPTTRTLRLSHKTVHSKKPKPTAEQEFLHYQWFADYGHAEAARAVAHLLSHGADRDYKKAVGYLLQAAEAGDAGAMAHMGHMYANGLAVPQDFDKAREWFWRAGELGHPSGFFGLGFTHLTGQGADIDFKQAFVYFRRAVETGQEWSGLGDGFLFLGKTPKGLFIF